MKICVGDVVAHTRENMVGYIVSKRFDEEWRFTIEWFFNGEKICKDAFFSEIEENVVIYKSWKHYARGTNQSHCTRK